MKKESACEGSLSKFFWTISLIFSAFCATFLIIELVTKVQNVPIIIYLSDEAIPISRINHPAVTVCSGLRSRLYNQSDIFDTAFKGDFGMFEKHTHQFQQYYDIDIRKNWTEIDHDTVGRSTYYDLLQKIDRDEVKAEDLNMRILKRLQIVDLVTKHGTFERKNLSIPTDNFLYHFNEFQHVTLTKTTHFTFFAAGANAKLSTVLTRYGLCYTYNLPFHTEMYDDELTAADFFHEFFIMSYVYRMTAGLVPDRAKPSSTILIVFGAKPSFYNEVHNDHYDGHLLYIHDSYELPTESSTPIFINNYADFKIFIEPELHVTDESLMEFKPTERNCYLEHEKSLKFFKVYTKTNCEHECLADYVLSRCACVEFFMIRNFTTRICSANEKSCFDAAKNDFDAHRSSCGCFQPCNYIKFDEEPVPLSLKSHDYRVNGFQFSATIAFRKYHENQIVRKKHFNEVDFLSFVGGLLGLFAGFSALSSVEFVYWIFKKMLLLFYSKKNPAIHPQIVAVKERPQDEDLVKIEGLGTDTTRLNQEKNNLTYEFLTESSIHGFNYMFSTSILETAFWIFAFIFSISCCVTLIFQTNEKVPDSRVVSLDENLEHIGNILFPAVTFVPYKSKKMADVIKVQNSFKNLTLLKTKFEADPIYKEELLRNASKNQFCIIGFPTHIFQLNEDVRDIINEVLVESSQLEFFRQQFASFNGKFAVNFSETVTGTSLGYTFNLVDFDDQFYADEVGDIFRYSRNITMLNNEGLVTNPDLKYPIRMDIHDKVFELTLKIRKQRELFDATLMRCGYTTFYIHDPLAFPNFPDNPIYISVIHGVTVKIDVTPEVVKTDDDLRKLSPEVRECYFEGERKLKFFKIYTLKNCEIECNTNLSISTCGCAQYNQLRNEKLGVKFCHTLKQMQCIGPLGKVYASVDRFSPERNCSCLPTCNSVSYNAKYHHEFNVEDEELDKAIFHVRMRTDETILYRRYQQFTFSDVVSYVGGLLGLFAGISMLSIVEIFYFFTIRAGVNFWRGFRGG